ncbi:MAG: hypothetical protein CVT62_04335 [Actinobacteria bacterium HGW-Actinobacteria-2]|nr:MAG: hypothetical protein CVT62_04335 [Actinobacteria bacterium HGW-Actinobacteria-2]
MTALMAGVKRSLAVVLVAFALLMATMPTARADGGQLASYNAVASIGADGVLSVTATLTFDGAAPASVQQVFTTARRTTQSTEYRFAVTDVTAASGSTALDVKVASGPISTTVDVPTAGATGPITLSYKVTGAAVANVGGGTVVVWPLLQGLSVPVKVFDAEVRVPAQFNLLDCAAGDPAAPGSCTYYAGGTHDAPVPVFHQEDSRSGDVVVVTLGFPAGQVAVNENVRQLWTAERAFSVAPLPLGLGVGLLLIGGLALWAAQRRVGRDFAGSVEPKSVAEFKPIAAGKTEFVVADGIRPGVIGTLADERVDPVDVTAAVLDLAVRGHILISELPRETVHSATDWSFTRRQVDAPLADYERTLLNAIAPVQGDAVKLSNLPGSLHSVIGDVQSQLYDEVVANGWFARRPDATRDRWGLAAWIALIVATAAAVGLILFTTFGLAGLALVLIALGLLGISKEMPARTAEGIAVLRGLDVLRGNLATHPVENLSGPDAYTQISALVPYAVVLGGRDRWLAALASADDDDVPDSDDLDWYHGPSGWHLADLPASLNNFVTVMQGTLFSR